ncbi:MAG: hypothetical protein EOO96_05930 [Pedobacter sp.]|nr:MAG: hypothetical protein EOO96_05930 [Pedobacter sp.]
MKKALMLSFAILTQLFFFNFVSAQEKISLSKFVGAWEFVKPPLPPNAPSQPFITTLKVFDENGGCLQLKVSEQGTVIWQTAKIEVQEDGLLKESINYSISPNLTNTTSSLKCSFMEDSNGNKFFAIQGGHKVVDGKDTYAWGELWRKVEHIKK